jgi:hypothetical protein
MNARAERFGVQILAEPRQQILLYELTRVSYNSASWSVEPQTITGASRCTGAAFT